MGIQHDANAYCTVVEDNEWCKQGRRWVNELLLNYVLPEVG